MGCWDSAGISCLTMWRDCLSRRLLYLGLQKLVCSHSACDSIGHIPEYESASTHSPSLACVLPESALTYITCLPLFWCLDPWLAILLMLGLMCLFKLFDAAVLDCHPFCLTMSFKLQCFRLLLVAHCLVLIMFWKPKFQCMLTEW